MNRSDSLYDTGMSLLQVNILFEEYPVPMRRGESRMDWLKRFKIKPVKINITTVKNDEQK